MYSQVANAYQKTQQTTASPRELEASLLIRAAARLQTVHDCWDTADADLEGAIVFNRRLWTMLATSGTSDDNPLPREIKVNVANLAGFILAQSMRILAEPQRDKLPTLISINANVAAGLRGSAQ